MSSTVTITWTVIFLGALWAPICHWSSTVEYNDNIKAKYEDQNNGDHL